MPKITDEMFDQLVSDKPCTIDRCVDVNKKNWYSRNSIDILDCVPFYVNDFDDDSERELTDLKTACRQSINNLNKTIVEAQKIKSQLSKIIQGIEDKESK